MTTTTTQRQTTLDTPPSVSIDFDAWTINGERMTCGERAILAILVERAGTAVSKRDLYLARWGRIPQTAYGELTSRSLDTAISRLRRKGVPLITIWGFGWLLPLSAIVDGLHIDARLRPARLQT